MTVFEVTTSHFQISHVPFTFDVACMVQQGDTARGAQPQLRCCADRQPDGSTRRVLRCDPIS